jgi:hypothetical protein
MDGIAMVGGATLYDPVRAGGVLDKLARALGLSVRDGEKGGEFVVWIVDGQVQFRQQHGQRVSGIWQVPHGDGETSIVSLRHKCVEGNAQPSNDRHAKDGSVARGKRAGGDGACGNQFVYVVVVTERVFAHLVKSGRPPK